MAQVSLYEKNIPARLATNQSPRLISMKKPGAETIFDDIPLPLFGPAWINRYDLPPPYDLSLFEILTIPNNTFIVQGFHRSTVPP